MLTSYQAAPETDPKGAARALCRQHLRGKHLRQFGVLKVALFFILNTIPLRGPDVFHHDLPVIPIYALMFFVAVAMTGIVCSRQIAADLAATTRNIGGALSLTIADDGVTLSAMPAACRDYGAAERYVWLNVGGVVVLSPTAALPDGQRREPEDAAQAFSSVSVFKATAKGRGAA